jgi:hypothetical protein
MTVPYFILYRSAQVAAVLAILLSIAVPVVPLRVQFALAVGIILLIGIPSGAIHHPIFQNLVKLVWKSREMILFCFNCVLLATAYAMQWWLIAVCALSVFIVIFACHFGQSNWNYVDLCSKPASRVVYLSGRGFLLSVSVLFFIRVFPLLHTLLVGRLYKKENHQVRLLSSLSKGN